MKTTETNTDYSNLTEEQLKAVAILQHTGEAFFVLIDKVYLGTEEEAKTAYEHQGQFPIDNFVEYCAAECIEAEPYDENDYNMAYMCLTDSEADDKAAEYIKDSLWAFNASFLANETGLDEEIFQAIIDNGKCEGNNNLIYNTIDRFGNMDEFVQSAISADGRGHFISSYDGEENEETVDDETFYIYRMN